MVIEIRDREIKEMFLAARKREQKEGVSIEDLVLDIIYGDDTGLALEGMKLYYTITMSSDLSMDEIEEDFQLGQVIPFKRDNDDNS